MNIHTNNTVTVTDMKLENSSGASRMKLEMQRHFFCLSVLRLQSTATQEINTMW